MMAPLTLLDGERLSVSWGVAGIHATACYIAPDDRTMTRRHLTTCTTLHDPAVVGFGAAADDAARQAITALRMARGLADECGATGCDVCDDPTCYRNAHGSALPY